MEQGGLAYLPLVVGFPVLLFVTLGVLGWLEAWMVQPDERAAAVQKLLDQEEEVEWLERAVATLMAPVAQGPRPQASPRHRRPPSAPTDGPVRAGYGVS